MPQRAWLDDPLYQNWHKSMVVVYEITPWSPVKGDHAGQGLEYMICEDRLKKVVLLSLEERKLKGRLYFSLQLPDEWIERRQPDSTKGCTVIRWKAMDIVGTWKILIRPKEFLHFLAIKIVKYWNWCPEKLWDIYPWRVSNRHFKQPWATWSD